MSATQVSATPVTKNLIREAAASTRHDDTDATAATVLASYAETARVADEMLKAQIKVARSMGLSWQQIGDVFGVTKQAAQKRFGAKA